jgi:hypothetical protein
VPQLDERREQDDAYRQAAAWRILLTHASTDAPAPPKGAAAAAAAALAAAAGGSVFGSFGGMLLPAVAKQFTVGRSQRGLEENAALQRLASLGGARPPAKPRDGAPGEGEGEEEEEAPPAPLPLIAALAQRLNACLEMKSHAAIASACRAVAALAEARARAIALARSPGERDALLGGPEVEEQMGALRARMVAVAKEPGFSAAQRLKALEALIWLQPLPLPPGKAPLISPEELLQQLSMGAARGRGKQLGCKVTRAMQGHPCYARSPVLKSQSGARAAALGQRPCSARWLLTAKPPPAPRLPPQVVAPCRRSSRPSLPTPGPRTC